MKHVSGIVVEKHGTRRPHQLQDKIGPKWCDIPKCDIRDDEQVVRILSKEFVVNTQKIQLDSQLVIAEAKVSDYRTLAAAKAAVLRQAHRKPQLTIDILNKIKRPLEHGYSMEEVVVAMQPYIIKVSKQYSTHAYPIDDAAQNGRMGVIQALRTDRAIAPFSKHCYLHIRTKIRRAGASNSGVISHGERDGDFFGRKGILLGIDEDGQKIFSTVTSADACLSDDGFNLYDIECDDNCIDPCAQAIINEEKQMVTETVNALIKLAALSEQQLKVCCLYYGLNNHIDNPYDCDSQSEEYRKWENGWEHTGTEIARALGCSRQRVGQQLDKSRDRLLRAAVIMKTRDLHNHIRETECLDICNKLNEVLDKVDIDEVEDDSLSARVA